MTTKSETRIDKGGNGRLGATPSTPVRDFAPAPPPLTWTEEKPGGTSNSTRKVTGEGELAPLFSAVQLLVGVAAIAVLVLIWWAIAVLGGYPPYILPTPAAVGERILSMLADGSLEGHIWATASKAGLGFLVASVVGTTVGYAIGRSRPLERFLSPYIAISQGLPVIAVAPLLAIWIRDDSIRKVLIVALIVFFPILINTIVGVRSIDRSMLEVARISGANFLQTIYYVELPLGLRPLLAGVRLGLTLAITGAVVAEFVLPSSGLGFLLTYGRGLFDTTLVFVGLVCLATLSVLSYILVTLLEKMLITWE